MRVSQIVAVDRVNLEGTAAAEPGLIWLYRDVVGLALVESGADETGLTEPRRICFKSGDIELRYCLVPEPKFQPVACCLTVEVPSLPSVRESLNEQGIRFELIRGLDHTDRRFSLLDPAGNRIEIKQHWPSCF